MELKPKLLDKKHLLIIVISIFSIIASYFNVTYAYFSDTKNQPISIKSVASFGESTVHDPNIFIEGNLTYTENKINMLKNAETLSFTETNVDNNDYLLTVATQVEPHTTEYEEDEYISISYEIFHKSDENLDTSGFTCENESYNNGISKDYCNTGTFIENSLEGLPFELIKDYRITDANTHYFDVYIYLNNDTDSKKIKTRIFYLDKAVEKKVEYKQELLKGNDPDLSIGLIPVVYDPTKGTDTNWFVADVYSEWYNYENQNWANAISVDSISEGIRSKYINQDGTYNSGEEIKSSDMLAMFVWIPRFSYTIGCTSADSCLGYKINGASNLTAATPGAIDIKFVSKGIKETYLGDAPTYTYSIDEEGFPTNDREPDNWYTHPAFDFGGEPLSGIWVGKFETSAATSSSCYNSSTNNCGVGTTEIRILPNVTSMRYQTISNQYKYSQYLTNNTLYGLNGDSHMMKNSEWGAVAYLSQSIYGKYGNELYSNNNKEIFINNYYGSSSSGYITGVSSGSHSASESRNLTCRYNTLDDRGNGTGQCGGGASTTGNISGIYDMSGGATEYVMGYFEKAIEETSYPWGSTSGGDKAQFPNDIIILTKYFNGYQNSDIFTKRSEVLGHATAETKNFYNDYSVEIGKTFPWVIRGGSTLSSQGAGIFCGDDDSGGQNAIYSFRITLTK